MADPKVSRNKTNPTETTPIIQRADKDIALRYKRINAQLAARVKSLDLTPDQAEKLLADCSKVIENWLLEGGEKQPWFSVYTMDAATTGAGQAVVSLSALTKKYTRTIEQVINSDAFISRVKIARIADYSHFKLASADLENRLAGVITQGIASGSSVKEVTKSIAESVGVSMSKAKSYAQTSIPGTLRQARIAENDYAREELGIRCGLLWASALKPHTRASHAARHGRVYTTQEVNDFYSKDGNQYNCLCAVTDCLVDEEGRLIASDKLRESMANEKAAWKDQ